MMSDLARLHTRQSDRTAADIKLGLHLQADGVERVQNRLSGAEVSCIGPDHCKVLRTVEKQTFDLRQNAIKLEPIERPQRPTHRVRGLNQRKWRTGFKNTMQLVGKDKMLRRVEGFEAKGRNRKIGRAAGQVGGQHVCAKMGYAIFPILVQPLDGLSMHSRADINGCDAFDTRKPAEQMRPNLTGACHQIDASRCGVTGQIQTGNAGFAPRMYQTKRRSRAPVSVGARASVKNASYKFGIIDVITHEGDPDFMRSGMQGLVGAEEKVSGNYRILVAES